MSVTPLLQEIAIALSTEGNHLRIRKLLFCACYNTWERDQEVLKCLDLADLIEQLYQQSNTLDEFTTTLNQVVRHLSRPTEYQQVADLIIEQITPLYDPSPEETQYFPTEETQFFPITHSPEQAIAQTLEQHPESLRLRKLLFCACYHRWNNSQKFLSQLDLIELLKNLKHQHSNLHELSNTLNEIINNLNRKNNYLELKDYLLKEIKPLFSAPESQQPDTSFASKETPTALVIPETELVHPSLTTDPPQNDLNSYEKEKHEIESPQNPINPVTRSQDLDKVITKTPQKIPESISSQDTTNYTPKTNTAYTDPSEVSIVGVVKAEQMPYDSFNIRLEVMKYANPLRAKILAFSAIHHNFTTTDPEWSSLRAKALDGLLQELYEQYKHLAELETQLYETAQNLEQPDESLQAAEAIVKAMNPYYENRSN